MVASLWLQARHSHLLCAGLDVTPQNFGRPAKVRTTLE